jgi:hypothetical protein
MEINKFGCDPKMVKSSKDVDNYFKKKKCKVELHPTPKAIEYWDEAKGSVIGLFHVTC